uniref:Histidine--tRNA ligase n=1 Tax=Anthurium amnicola TaxID=1678845 RepID=A0A1D1XS82_9ARAE
MKQKLQIFQYGSQLDPTGPAHYSPEDWISISFSDSSPSERSGSMGAPQVSNSSTYESDASFTDGGDLLCKICDVLSQRMDSIGMKLPPSIKMEEFVCYNLLGEETVGALDPSLLNEVLADLQLSSPIISWYWEAAFKNVLLLYNVII